jgi:FMN-dependent oxidoreductase (nitrilotriacetate monooxygenase family)
VFHLGWFLSITNHNWFTGPWDGRRGAEWNEPDFYVEMAQSLERACFDYLMFEDSLQVTDTYGGSREFALRTAVGAPQHDPMPFLPVIAAETRHVGLISTVSTSFYPPYLLARQAVTLDHLTGGRSGVNLVTSSTHRAAQNFGRDEHLEHDLRYEVADEWAQVVEGLWGGWDRDAVLADVPTGVYADHTKVSHLNFAGKHFRSRGPLNTVPGPQGRPVVCQAGGSPAGRDFGARHADTVLALVQGVDAMKAYRADLRARAAALGRDPDEVKVLFVVHPTLGDTDADAWAKKRRAEAAQEADYEALLANFSYYTNIDFSRFDPDQPLPEDLETNGHRSTLADLVAASRGRTLRELAGGYRLVESVELVGSPATVAERMGEVMAEVGGDGFLFSGPENRHYIAEIADGLAPELMRRGMTRSAYTTTTLREHLQEF